MFTRGYCPCADVNETGIISDHRHNTGWPKKKRPIMFQDLITDLVIDIIA